jgi:hypothetical protein
MNFFDLFDAVTSSQDKAWESGGSMGRNNGKAALVLVHLDAVGYGWNGFRQAV